MLRPWPLEISIDIHCHRAIYIQIADAIIEAIKSGKLLPGDALPGSRELCRLLKVNRNTIVEALEVLTAEGWLITKERKGTFVNEALPVKTKGALNSLPKATTLVKKPVVHISFDDGFPDSKLAPITELARAYRQIFNRKARWQMMGYSDELGDVAFRQAVAQMLNFKRGMKVTPEGICITRGSQMAMYLAAHCLIEEGDHVLIENPGYKPAWQAFDRAGAKLLPVAVDGEGLDIEQVRAYLAKYKSIKAIYVTPHHQFPTTVTMSLSRRLQLIALSNKHEFTIIEDDYDHEFHFGQRPVLPICSHDDVQHYIYIGTFSKIVAPALRIGFLASSNSFVQRVAELRRIIDVQGDNIMEQAVLQLIQDGEVKRHLKRMTLHYKQKRDAFEALILKHLKGKVEFTKPEGGLAFWLRPVKQVDMLKLKEKLLKKGVSIISPDKFSFDDPVNGLRIGYASLTEKQLEEGLVALASTL